MLVLVSFLVLFLILLDREVVVVFRVLIRFSLVLYWLVLGFNKVFGWGVCEVRYGWGVKVNGFEVVLWFFLVGKIDL